MKDGTENDPSLVYARMDEKGNFLPVKGSPASACCPECGGWLGISETPDGYLRCHNCKHTWPKDNSD